MFIVHSISLTAIKGVEICTTLIKKTPQATTLLVLSTVHATIRKSKVVERLVCEGRHHQMPFLRYDHGNKRMPLVEGFTLKIVY